MLSPKSICHFLLIATFAANLFSLEQELFLEACEQHDIEKIETLMTICDNHEDRLLLINAKDTHNRGALHKVLIPFFLNNKNEYDLTNNSIEIIKLLARYRANPNIQANGGFSPMHIACSIGSIAIIDTLLYFFMEDIFLDIKDDDGNVPLHYAMNSKDPINIVKLFLMSKKNINFDAQNKYNNTPLDMMLDLDPFTSKILLSLFIEANSVIAIKYLFDKNQINSLKGVLSLAAYHLKTDIISYLLDNGFNPQDQDLYGNTFIHVALLRNMPNLISILKRFDSLINYNTNNYFDMNLLDYAKISNNYELIDFMKKKNIHSSFDDVFLPILRAVINDDIGAVIYLYYHTLRYSALPKNIANLIFVFLVNKKSIHTLHKFIQEENLDINILNSYFAYKCAHNYIMNKNLYVLCSNLNCANKKRINPFLTYNSLSAMSLAYNYYYQTDDDQLIIQFLNIILKLTKEEIDTELLQKIIDLAVQKNNYVIESALRCFLKKINNVPHNMEMCYLTDDHERISNDDIFSDLDSANLYNSFDDD